MLNLSATGLVALLAMGWTWSIFNARDLAAARAEGGDVAVGRMGRVAAALTKADAPTTAYLTDAALLAAVNHALDKQRGASGKLQAAFEPTPAPLTPDSLPPGAALQYKQGTEVAAAPKGAGIWNVLLSVGNAIRPVAQLQRHHDAAVLREAERQGRPVLHRQLAERAREGGSGEGSGRRLRATRPVSSK